MPPILFAKRFRAEHSAYLSAVRAAIKTAQTPRGPIDYVSEGEGPCLLSVHGWGGGGHGGIVLTRYLVNHGFRVIAPFRAGYFGTPLSLAMTDEEQADAHAALLDALNIDRAAIAGFSGGTPSSLLFALRHPERCAGLVVGAGLSRKLPVVFGARLDRQIEKIFSHDYLIWLLITFFEQSFIKAAMGELPPDTLADPEKIDTARAILKSLITASLARDGIEADNPRWMNMPDYPVEQIKAPTLIFHARNDHDVPFSYAEFTARIPGSQLISFEDGGHLVYAVHSEITHPETLRLLKAVFG